MNYTWKEIQAAVLQKCFSWTDESSLQSSDNQDYISSMPHAANEGMQRIYDRIALRHSKKLELQAGLNQIDLKQAVPDWRGGSLEAWQQTPIGPQALPGSCIRLAAERWMQIMVPQTGDILLLYNAWPPKITAQTPDDFVLDIDQDAAVILPYYIASEIYGDDDPSVASSYRNRFEMALDELEASKAGSGIIVDTTGCYDWDL